MLFGTVAAQTVPDNFKFSENGKPGDPLKISGSGLDKVTSVTLVADGKPAITPDGVKIAPTEITFNLPAGANGKYDVVLAPGNIRRIPLTVAGVTVTSAQTPPSTDKPEINSVFPATTYPVQNPFWF